ncbi:hypothetical protein SELMODRAFT_443090 [Selaginella moellendorffii]|uniref:EF-hand domain-containing protein n=1 Tax=Selaginella moellendorffii TaxID=88036 RepID=D8RYB3_SELML|nr:hypothetical protein SELMODRAFT_443090 [Selaginella moellendorffii]
MAQCNLPAHDHSICNDPIRRLHQEAKAAYHKLPLEQRSQALRLFKGMDQNASRGVTRTEVERYSDPAVKAVALSCFDALDADHNRKLDFWETVTLAHILRVPGKLCGECSALLLYGPICSVCETDNCYPEEEP